MTLSSGKRAVITGASSGIGEATVLEFARAGIHVALVSRSEDKLEEVARSAQEHGVEAKSSPWDLARVEGVREQIERIATQFGPIDILVDRAGMGYTGSLMDASLADWQRILDLKLTSVFECVRGILSSMGERCQGAIVNVVSIAGQQVFHNWGAYCASKFGLMARSEALALEERERGIRAIAICPGAVNTSIWDTETVQADFERSTMLTPQTVAQKILQTVEFLQQAVIKELTLMSSAGVL